VFVDKAKACGFKFKTDEFYDFNFIEIAEYIKTNPDILIIHLRRRNIINQYISHQLVLRDKAKTNYKIGEDIPEIQPFKVNVNHLVEYIDNVINRDMQIKTDLHTHSIFNISYDDVCSQNEVFLQLQTFLGVESKKLKVQTKRIIDNHEMLVLNKKEVYAVRDQYYSEINT